MDEKGFAPNNPSNRLLNSISEGFDNTIEIPVANEDSHSTQSFKGTNLPPHSSDSPPWTADPTWGNIVSQLPIIFCELAPDGTILFVNEAVTKITGYIPKDIFGKNWWDVFYPAGLQPQVDDLYLRFQTGNVSDHKMVLAGKDGSLRTLIWNSVNKFTPEGKLTSIVGLGLDITEKQRSEGSLRLQNERLQIFNQIVDSSPDIISLVDRSYIYRMANSTYIRMHDRTSDEIIGQSMETILGQENFDKYVRPNLVRCFAGEVVNFQVYFTYRSVGKRYIDIFHYPLFQDGEVKYAVILVRDITDRKEADRERVRRAHEEAARAKAEASRQQISTILESISDAFVAVDSNWQFIYVNKKAEQVVGDTRDELTGRNIWDLFPETVNSRFYEAAQEAAVKKITTEAEGFYPPFNMWLEVRNFPTEDGLSIYIHDATEKKQAEKELRDSEQKYRLLIETLPDAVWIADMEGRTIFASPIIEKIFGYTFEEIYQGGERIWPGRIHPNDVKRVTISYGELFKGNKDLDIEYRIQRKDDEWIWIRERAIATLEKNGVRYAQGIFSDITESKKAAADLAKSEERFRLLAENAKDVVYRYEIRGAKNFSYLSPSIQNLVGYTPDEFYADPSLVSQVIHHEDLAGLRAMIDSTTLPDIQTTLRWWHRNGARVWTEQRSTPIYDATGGLIAIEGIIRDMTEHKKIEEQLLRAQRLETAGLVAGQIAHDFANLLGPIVGYPELMKLLLPEDHPTIKYCDIMLELAPQIIEMNENLLTLSRRGHFTQEPINLNTIVESAVAQVLSGMDTNRLKVKLNLASDLLPTFASRTQLTRVLSNLLTNAKEAINGKGLISIRTGNVFFDEKIEKQKESKNVPPGEYVKVEVSDTGYGIAPEIMDRIFEPFFTAKKGVKQRGSGLGLSIVQSVISDHKGFVDVESSIGIGTKFKIYLPVQRGALQLNAMREAPGGNEHILVVDDNEVQRELTGNMLKALGYEVIMVAGGSEALQFLKSHDIDLIVLDMVMPEGINGAETYRRAITLKPEIRAIFVSGYAESKQVGRAQDMGAGAYIRKPVTLESLARAVRRELDR